MPGIQRLITQYLEYLKNNRDASLLTIRNYSHYLLRFIDWLNTQKDETKLEDITASVIHNYARYLDDFKTLRRELLSSKTKGYHLIALRSFLRWLKGQGYAVIEPEVIQVPKSGPKALNFLTGEQIDKLLAAPPLSTPMGLRDKAILEVLFATGLRVSDLVKLDRDTLDPEMREFKILSRGGNPRVIFLTRRAAEWVRRYLAVRNEKYKPLFIRYAGQKEVTGSDEKMRLTPRSVQRLIKKYARKIKLPVEVTPHVLRHSFATDLLMAGADIRSVQEMLGHKNISTTQIYTHVTNRQLREVHEAFHRGNK